MLDVRRIRIAQDDAGAGSFGLPDGLEILVTREGLHLPVLPSVLLGVDDDPHVHAAVDRGLEGLRNGFVVELVEAARSPSPVGVRR